MFDKQGNGTIPNEKVGDLLRSLGHNPTEAQVEQLVQSFPTSKSTVTFDQLLAAIQAALASNPNKFQPQTTAEEFIQGFQVFDKDNNGLISIGELRYVLTSLGEKMTDAEVDELVKYIEVNKNGYVNYEQLVNLIMSG